MLQIADVNKLRCNFVSAIYDYFTRKKYEITVCNDEAIQAYIDFKLAQSYECPLPVHEQCRLENIEEKVPVVSCESQDFVCSLQASFKLQATSHTETYTTTLENRINGSAFPFVEINTGIYPKAYISFVTRDSLGNIYDEHEVASGSILAGGTSFVSTDYDLGALMVMRLNGYGNDAGSYIKTINLYRTDISGIYTEQFQEIDVSPLTSPYLNSYWTVNPADLYFTASSWAVAFDQILQNAVKSITGNKDHIISESQKLPDNSLRIRTRVNHSPQTFYWGLEPSVGGSKSFAVVHKGSTGEDIKHVLFDYPINREPRPGWFSAKYDLVLPTGTETLIIPNTNISFPINPITKFNLMAPASNFASPALTIEGNAVTIDNQVVLNATITTSQSYTSRWLNPSSVEIATTDNVLLHNPTAGVYTFELTLASGCVLTKTITI